MSSADLLHVTGYAGKRRLGDQRIRGVTTDKVGPQHVCPCGCPATVEEYDDSLAGKRYRITRCQGKKADSKRAGMRPRCEPSRQRRR